MICRDHIKNHKTIIIKIGSSSIVKATGEACEKKIQELANVLSELKNQGKDVLLVSSGAIALGQRELDFSKRPRDVLGQQVASSVGQSNLTHLYEKFFKKCNQKIAQILITRDVFSDKAKVSNLKNTILKLFELNIIPILNENDVISLNENEPSDNDTLAAMIAKTINADILILLSDINGVYTKDPNVDKDAKFIEAVLEIDENIKILSGTSFGSLGTGGMATKIRAAEIATFSGADLVICSGKTPSILFDILNGENIGTLFFANKNND